MSQPVLADEEGVPHLCDGIIRRFVVPISRTEDGRSDTVDGKYSRTILRKLELVENRASYLELASFGGAVGCLLPSCTCVSIEVLFFGSPHYPRFQCCACLKMRPHACELPCTTLKSVERGRLF